MEAKKKTAYRLDIDGLRAIAVLLVVIFHAGFEELSGGFIGVDVFFIISGFLITSLVKKEIDNHSFSFKNFYERRILRLLPALNFVLIITSMFALAILFPPNLKSFAYSLLSVYLAVSNVYFWRNNGGYFEGDAAEEPLLHTWSLAVEEQFYFIWPFILILCFKYFKRLHSIIFLSAMFIAAIVLSEWATKITIGAAYYLLPTRMFELLAGALLALAWRRIPSSNCFFGNIFSIVGLSLIIYSSFILNESSSFPGLNALYPTIGTILIIYAGKNKRLPTANYLLTLTPIRYIGLISYSLYLWHWPVIVFFLLLGFEFSFWKSIFLILVSIFLAILSYEFVEKRFRYPKIHSFSRTLTFWYLIPLLVTILFVALISATNGIPERFTPEINQKLTAINSLPEKGREGCHKSNREYQTKPNSACVLGETKNFKARAFLMGDSHANHFNGLIDSLAKDANILVNNFSMDACLPLFDVNVGQNEYFGNFCETHNRLAKAYIKQQQYDYVIFAANWPGEKNFARSTENNDNLIEDIQLRALEMIKHNIDFVLSTGAKPVIFQRMYSLGGNSTTCVLKKQLYNKEMKCDISSSKALENNGFMRNVIKQLKEISPLLLVVDPLKLACDENWCPAELNNVPLFRDKYHLNEHGSNELATFMKSQIGNPFLDPNTN